MNKTLAEMHRVKITNVPYICCSCKINIISYVIGLRHEKG